MGGRHALESYVDTAVDNATSGLEAYVDSATSALAQALDDEATAREQADLAVAEDLDRVASDAATLHWMGA